MKVPIMCVCMYVNGFMLRQLHVRTFYFLYLWNSEFTIFSFISFQMRLMEVKTRSERVTSVTSVQWVRNVFRHISQRRTPNNPNSIVHCARKASPKSRASRSIWSRFTTWHTRVYNGFSLWSTPVSGPHHKLQEHPLVLKDRTSRLQPYLQKHRHQTVVVQPPQPQKEIVTPSQTSWVTLMLSGLAMMVRTYYL